MSVKSEMGPGFRAEAIDVFETCDLPEADQHLLTSGLDLEAGETVESWYKNEPGRKKKQKQPKVKKESQKKKKPERKSRKNQKRGRKK